MVSNNLVKPENTLQPSLFAARNVPVKRTVPSGVERGQTAVFICVQPRSQANSRKASQQRRLGTHRDSSRPGKKWQKSLISEKKGLDDCSTKNLLSSVGIMEYFGRTKHLWIVLNGRNEMSSQGVKSSSAAILAFPVSDGCSR